MLSVGFERRWFASLADELVNKLRNSGYHTLLSMVDPEKPDDERSCIEEMMLGGHADGCIAGPVLKRNRLRPYWNVINEGPPIVFFGGSEDLPVNFVDINHVEGVGLAIRHLVSCGHKRIGYLCCHEEPIISNTRRYGFERAMNEAGLIVRHEDLLVGRGTYESGYKVMKACLEQRGRDLPSALFCQSDVVAIGAIRALDEHGLSVPDDISLVGYDDIEEAFYCRPALTTVGSSLRILVGKLHDILISKIENGDGKLIQEFVTPKLIVRDSSAEVRK